MDFDIARKTSGARFVFLKSKLALLERAITNFMLDVHTKKFAYQEISPPLIVNENFKLLMKNDLKKINKVLSVNVMLTSEKIPDKQNPNNHKWKIKAKKIIAIASGKGGLGKSTFSTNFAVA